MDARLIIDGPASGSWNMAVDEALLRAANETGRTAVRFYQWADPTLSLGYFQRLEERQSHAPSGDLPVVRRSTGGGAIVHHHELTYSLTHPIRDRFGASPLLLVEKVHQALVRVLATVFGVSAQLCRGAESPPAFLCFERRSELDVLCGNWKVAGSAQRRHHRAMTQHGSVLLTRSEYAPQLLGISDVTGINVRLETLIEALSQQLADDLQLVFVKSSLEASEQQLAESIEAERYARSRWTSRR